MLKKQNNFGCFRNKLKGLKKSNRQNVITAQTFSSDMISIPILILASCVLVISFIEVRSILKGWRAESAAKRALLDTNSAYHVEDYHADTRCDICFDSMDSEEICDCVCGKTFHRSCAEPTGSCPYCGNPFDRFPIKSRESRSLTCFRCGEKMDGNVCGCGTVIPYKDGTFSCPCGECLSETAIWCPNCGRTYERRRCLIDKGLCPKG